MKTNSMRITIALLLSITLNSQSSQKTFLDKKLDLTLAEQRLTVRSEIKEKYLKECYKANKITAQTHNRSIPLLQLPLLALSQILEFSTNPIHSANKNIKSSSALRATCTEFCTIMSEFDILHIDHSDDEKYKAMEAVQLSIKHGNYKKERRALWFLIYAKAPHNTNPRISLLHKAVEENDIEIASALFQHGANANEKNKDSESPIFFDIKSKAMLQLFAHNNVNWRTTHKGYTILHRKTDVPVFTQKSIETLVALLPLIPSLINFLSTYKSTALDYAQLNYENLKGEEKIQKKFLIDLLIKHGANTSQELKQERIYRNIILLKKTSLR
jgi:hypothetical protein